jgi:hypothetical protein
MLAISALRRLRAEAGGLKVQGYIGDPVSKTKQKNKACLRGW